MAPLTVRPLKQPIVWTKMRWGFNNWLLQPASSQDTSISQELEAHLVALYQECIDEHFAQAYEQWQHIGHELLKQASPRQLARHYFLGTELACALEKWGDGYDHARLCKHLIPAEDWVSQIQLASKLGVCEMYTKHYIPAINTFNLIIEQRKKGKYIRFIKGEWQSLLANTYFLRGKAAHSSGHFEKAQADLLHAILLINSRLKSIGLNAPITSGVEAFATPMPLLSLDVDKVSSLLPTSDASLKVWLELYLYIAWQYALNSLWQFKVDPESFTLDVWRDAQQIIQVAAQSSGSLADVVGNYAADLHCCAAEVSLTICENLPLKKWDPEIRDARASLAVAEAIPYLRVSQPTRAVVVSQHLVKFMSFYCEYWSARQDYARTGSTDLLWTLSHDIEKHITQAQKDGLSHIEGRHYFLLGRVYESLERDPASALRYYQKALDIFEREPNGFYPHIAETRHAIQKLLG